MTGCDEVGLRAGFKAIGRYCTLSRARGGLRLIFYFGPFDLTTFGPTPPK